MSQTADALEEFERAPDVSHVFTAAGYRGELNSMADMFCESLTLMSCAASENVAR